MRTLVRLRLLSQRAHAHWGHIRRNARVGRSLRRSEITEPLEPSQGALTNSKDGQREAAPHDGPYEPLGIPVRVVALRELTLSRQQRTFNVVERVPRKRRGTSQVKCRLQRPQMLFLMNAIPVQVCGYQHHSRRSARPQPEREVG